MSSTVPPWFGRVLPTLPIVRSPRIVLHTKCRITYRMSSTKTECGSVMFRFSSRIVIAPLVGHVVSYPDAPAKTYAIIDESVDNGFIYVMLQPTGPFGDVYPSLHAHISLKRLRRLVRVINSR